MRRIATLALCALLAGCQAAAQGQITLTPGAKGPAKPTVAKVRAVEVKVVAPGQLASAGGASILTDGGAGLIKGGQILTDGGAGLIRAADAALPRFGLLDALATFKPVKAAGVQAVGLDGKAIGAVITTDDQGGAKVEGLPQDRAVSVFAAFRTGGKVYRLAATLGADAFDGTLMLDPINTMVEARVRDLLKGAHAPTITNARLKAVWGICNKADITLTPEELEAGRSLAEITETLDKAWKAAIDAKVTNEAEKAEIKSFIADLEAAGAK